MLEITQAAALDARRYRAFIWLMCCTDEQREAAAELLQPLLAGVEQATPALVNAAMDQLGTHIATLY